MSAVIDRRYRRRVRYSSQRTLQILQVHQPFFQCANRDTLSLLPQRRHLDFFEVEWEVLVSAICELLLGKGVWTMPAARHDREV